MKSLASVAGLLLVAASVVSPAQANWFSTQKNNSMWSIGSVRNPTPQELRFFYAKQAAQEAARNGAVKK